MCIRDSVDSLTLGGQGDRERAAAFLLAADKDSISPDERAQIMKALIAQGCYSEAYDMLCRYGSERLETADLKKLCLLYTSRCV